MSIRLTKLLSIIKTKLSDYLINITIYLDYHNNYDCHYFHYTLKIKKCCLDFVVVIKYYFYYSFVILYDMLLYIVMIIQTIYCSSFLINNVLMI